jgi:photosynthetic reaction center cytochrome c subunit
MKWLLGLVVLIGAVVSLSIILSEADRPPVGEAQRGFRGTGLVALYNPRTMDGLLNANIIPASLPYSGMVGPKAGTVYKNVQVLGDVNAGEFTRLMVNMTTWVAPGQGCAACHNTANFTEDSKYTKVVARRMLQMVRHINADWTSHVAQTGVTCYTCHRGQLVPPNIWFNGPVAGPAGGFAQEFAGKNHPTEVAGDSALPSDPYTPFLEKDANIRVQSTTALHAEDHQSIKQTEWTYSLMMNISQALGVNCDYCHSTRSFGDWSQSPPQRLTAWYGIRMVRDLNNRYLDPLRATFPPNRLGPTFADAPKIRCATCHNGVFKPLFGVSMLPSFPELRGP